MQGKPARPEEGRRLSRSATVTTTRTSAKEQMPREEETIRSERVGQQPERRHQDTTTSPAVKLVRTVGAIVRVYWLVQTLQPAQ